MPDDAENKREMEEPGCGPAPPADQQGGAPAEEQDWDVAKRILAFAAAAVMIYASVWLGCHAVRYAGPLLVGLAMLLAAAVLLGAGLAMTAMGLLGVPRWQAPGEGGDLLEQEAERRGLPTDPEAYQNGGVGVAATARTTAEAELIASRLNARNIPAWADQPHASTWLSHAQFALNPEGVRVLVPLGRLADAKRVIAAHPRQEGQAEEASGEVPARPFRRTGAAVFLLCLGLGMVLWAAALTMDAGTDGLEATEAVVLIVWGLLGLVLCVAGILGLRSGPEPED